MVHALASIFRGLVGWGWVGLGGVVAGVVGGVVVCGCDGLPRVGSWWLGLSGGRGSFFRIVVDKMRELCVYGAGGAWRCSSPVRRRSVQGWSVL